MDPYQVIFHVPKNPPPQLQNKNKWTDEFNDLIAKCLKKDAKERLAAKDLLQVYSLLAPFSQNSHFTLKAFICTARKFITNITTST